MSQSTPRRYGPALTMGVAILAALALAILAPFNMMGDWNDPGKSTPPASQTH